MKRILFVDDEPMVLEGLQRSLRPFRDEWEMLFVESGEKALAALAASPVDVVVADMRMPGMDGAQLLKEVMCKHPSTIRIVLSGYTERDMITRCVGVAHQYLAKPCEAAALRRTIERVTALEHTLEAGAMQRLVGRLERLPSLPVLYTEILRALQNASADLDDIGKLISRDLGMTAKVLKLVNSAFYGLPREIASPSEAALYLGMENVKSLVLAAKTFGQFQALNVPGFYADKLWQHSLDVATAAQKIARVQQAPRLVQEQAFVAGLLHDVGKLILALNLREQYTSIEPGPPGSNRDLWKLERERLGASHADVGAYLLGLWGLPAAVIEAIALHHQPADAGQTEFTPLTAVYIANMLLQPEARAALDYGYLQKLGLLGAMPAWEEVAAGFAPATEPKK